MERTCELFGIDMERAQFDQLPADRQEALDAHLAACEPCGTLWDVVRESAQLLAAPASEPPSRSWPEIHRRLRWTVRLPWLRLYAALAVLAVTAGTAGWWAWSGGAWWEWALVLLVGWRAAALPGQLDDIAERRQLLAAFEEDADWLAFYRRQTQRAAVASFLGGCFWLAVAVGVAALAGIVALTGGDGAHTLGWAAAAAGWALFEALVRGPWRLRRAEAAEAL